MRYFIAGKESYKRTAEALIILAVLFSGVYFYDLNKEYFENFNYYYVKSYLKARDIKKENIVANSSGNAVSIPVITYHGAIGKSDGYNVLSDDFINQMVALKKGGWQTVTLRDFHAFMRGERDLPDKSFLLTFDDGRKDSYYPVDPILEALDYNAVIFVITKYSLDEVDSDYYLSKNELQKMQESGRWEIESHTRDGHNLYKINQDGEKGHFYSNKLWLDDKNRLESNEEFIERIRQDFISAKEDVEQGLGVDVLGFAYPFGDFGQDSVNFPESKSIILEMIESIYPLSFYQVREGDGTSFNYTDPTQFLIKRIEVRAGWSADDLLTVLNAAKEKSLPFDDNFISDMGWRTDWGSLTKTDKTILIGANEKTTGGSAFLDGSKSWRDYRFNISINKIDGESVSLIARYRDDQNYLACTYTDRYIRLDQFLNGEKSILAEVKSDHVFGAKDFGIQVKGNVSGCTLDNVAIVETMIDASLTSGGVGVRTWDQVIGKSRVNISMVNVSESYIQYTQAEPEVIMEPVKVLPKITLPYLLGESPELESNWERTWGEFSYGDNGLALASSIDTTGAEVYLSGSEDWKNYSINTKIDWREGSSLVVHVRYRDGGNYAAFSIGEEYSRIEKYENGKRKVVQEMENDKRLSKGVINVKINVTDARISAFINDEMVLSDSNALVNLPFGGIGFKVWDKKVNSSGAFISELSALPR